MQITELQPKPQTLNFNGHEFTMILINGEPYFNANEVASTLEFANPRDAVANHVDSDDVALADTLTKGGVQKQKFINESGLYALIFASKKPSAKDFKKWVTKEVIPSIRKTGSYSLQPQIALPQDYLSALKALVTSEEQKQALAIENQTLKPKAEQWQRFIDTDGLLPSRTIGKLLGFKSAQEFNKAIKEKRVAFKADDGTWQFYADFKDKEIGKMVAWEKGEYNKAKERGWVAIIDNNRVVGYRNPTTVDNVIKASSINRQGLTGVIRKLLIEKGSFNVADLVSTGIDRSRITISISQLRKDGYSIESVMAGTANNGTAVAQYKLINH